MVIFLRWVGLLNAAVWFGAAVYFFFAVGPATSSPDLQRLIGSNNFPYFSVAIGQLLAERYFWVLLVCGLLSLVHLMAEWLYFGKYPSRYRVGLVLGLCLLGLARGAWLQPTVARAHQTRFAPQSRPEQKENAARTFVLWQKISRGTDFVLICGLALYLWGVGNPSDSTRFVPAGKFRS